MNNKGQSLVLFILLIPILIGIITLVCDCGRVYLCKVEQENISAIALEYGLDNDKSLDKVNTILRLNLGDSNYSVTEDNDKISIKIKGEVKGIFSRLFGFFKFEVETTTKGFIENDKVVIEKIK